MLLPRTHAQGVKQLVCPSVIVVVVVVVVVGMKITRSQDIESDKCHQTIRINRSLLLSAKQGS